MARAASEAEKKILIVKTGEPVPRVAERRGQFTDLIEQAIGDVYRGGYEIVDLRTERAPNPASARAVVITGSAANVPTRDAWIQAAEAWLRDVVASGTPTFGICFGHQILAQALGGDVQKNPRGREIGTVEIELLDAHEDPILTGLPRRFEANLTHVDSVLRLPPGAAALARSARDDHQIIRFTSSCYGVQFHPEIDAEVMRIYVETRREILTAEGLRVDPMLEAIRDAAFGREALRNFVRRFVV